jgi:hypothetical protein
LTARLVDRGHLADDTHYVPDSITGEELAAAYEQGTRDVRARFEQKAELRAVALSSITDLMEKIPRGSQYPGDLVGAVGALALIAVIALEETANRLTGQEFTIALIVFAILTIAGPLMAMLAYRLGMKAVVEVANRQAETAANQAEEAKALAEARATELRLRGVKPAVAASTSETPGSG